MTVTGTCDVCVCIYMHTDTDALVIELFMLATIPQMDDLRFGVHGSLWAWRNYAKRAGAQRLQNPLIKGIYLKSYEGSYCNLRYIP